MNLPPDPVRFLRQKNTGLIGFYEKGQFLVRQIPLPGQTQHDIFYSAVRETVSILSFFHDSFSSFRNCRCPVTAAVFSSVYLLSDKSLICTLEFCGL